MIINEQEFCWRVWCRAFYFMFPQKQAWFPCTNKFIPYSNAWHIYAKVLEIKTCSTVFFSTRPVSHFFLFSSFIKSEWRVDSETHCEELHLTVYWQRPQKWTNFFSHSRWQIVLYIAESLNPCPIHWYMLTMLFIKPRRKWKISIIPRIRLAWLAWLFVCQHTYEIDSTAKMESLFLSALNKVGGCFGKLFQTSLNLLLSILYTNPVYHHKGNWLAYLRDVLL